MAEKKLSDDVMELRLELSDAQEQLQRQGRLMSKMARRLLKLTREVEALKKRSTLKRYPIKLAET